MRKTGEVGLPAPGFLSYLHFEDSCLTLGARAGGITSLGGEEGSDGATPGLHRGAGCPVVGGLPVVREGCVCLCKLDSLGVLPLAAALLKESALTRVVWKMVYNQ